MKKLTIILTTLFVLVLFIFPSIPKYKFEEETLSKFTGKDYIRIAKRYKSGSFLEPLTLLHTPVTSILAIRPNSNIDGGGYTEMLFKFDKKPEIRIVDPDCSQGTASYSEPDIQGVFRVVSHSKEMSKFDNSLYCEYDWTKENKALYKAAKDTYNK